jgi:hypothetical protein
LRTEADGSADEIGELFKGEIICTMSVRGDWGQVKFPNDEGTQTGNFLAWILLCNKRGPLLRQVEWSEEASASWQQVRRRLQGGAPVAEPDVAKVDGAPSNRLTENGSSTGAPSGSSTAAGQGAERKTSQS